MRKTIKRAVSLAVSAFMISKMLPYGTMAFDTSDLTIQPYWVTDEQKITINTASTGQASDEENVIAGATKVTAGEVTFQVDYVDINGNVQSNAATDLAVGDTLPNLPHGYYKITPKNTTTDTKFQDAEAFYIQLPLGDEHAYLFPKLTKNNNPVSPTPDDSIDPADSIDPDDNTKTTAKHSIKLTSTLSDQTTWDSNLTATFALCYQDDLGKWIGYDGTTGRYAYTYTTDSNGEIIIDGLPFGTYYLTEISAPQGYLLDQTPVKFELDGSGDLDKQVKNFVHDKELTVSKEVNMDGQGKNYNWTIWADLPTNTDNIIEYIVTDKYSNLKNVDTVSVFALTGSSDTNPMKLTKAIDFSTSSDHSAKTATVSLTASGVSKIKGKTKLRINITSEEELTGSETIVTNTSSISYKYAYNPDNDNPVPGFPGITDPDQAVPAGSYPAAINYPANTGGELDPADPQTDAFKPTSIIISNVDSESKAELWGKFDISGCSLHADNYDNSIDGTGDDDLTDTNLLTLKNLAPGKYTIKQAGTESDHTFNANDVRTIFIDKDGKIYEGDKVDANKLITPNASNVVIITFENAKKDTRFFLPFTGTTATIVYTGIGLILMSGAAFLIFVIFRKKDEEENKTN